MTFGFGAVVDSVATIVALIGVAVSFWLTRRGQKQDLTLAREEADRGERAQRASEASAERSEAASSLTIDALTRMADALESLDLVGAGAKETGPEVAWSLTHFNGDTYQLANTGRRAATHVKVSAHESLMMLDPAVEEAEIGPSEAVTFMAVRTMGTVDSTITVEWTNSAGDRGRWRYPLPPRPPRR